MNEHDIRECIKVAAAAAVERALAGFREQVEQVVADVLAKKLAETPRLAELHQQGKKRIAADADAKRVARLHGPGNGKVEHRHVAYVEALRLLGDPD